MSYTSRNKDELFVGSKVILGKLKENKGDLESYEAILLTFRKVISDINFPWNHIEKTEWRRSDQYEDETIPFWYRVIESESFEAFRMILDSKSLDIDSKYIKKYGDEDHGDEVEELTIPEIIDRFIRYNPKIQSFPAMKQLYFTYYPQKSVPGISCAICGHPANYVHKIEKHLFYRGETCRAAHRTQK